MRELSIIKYQLQENDELTYFFSNRDIKFVRLTIENDRSKKIFEIQIFDLNSSNSAFLLLCRAVEYPYKTIFYIAHFGFPRNHSAQSG